MSKILEWLPPLVLLSEYNGNWDQYIEVIYTYFKKDLIDNKPVFQGRTLKLKSHPFTNGKEATFWHVISEGKEEEDRIPDLRRCERIRWPKPIIEHDSDLGIKYWVSVKKNEDRIHIWLEEEDYVVVLADRKEYILLWTAYLITRRHTKEKLIREYERYWKGKV